MLFINPSAMLYSLGLNFYNQYQAVYIETFWGALSQGSPGLHLRTVAVLPQFPNMAPLAIRSLFSFHIYHNFTNTFFLFLACLGIALQFLFPMKITPDSRIILHSTLHSYSFVSKLLLPCTSWLRTVEKSWSLDQSDFPHYQITSLIFRFIHFSSFRVLLIDCRETWRWGHTTTTLCSGLVQWI